MLCQMQRRLANLHSAPGPPACLPPYPAWPAQVLAPGAIPSARMLPHDVPVDVICTPTQVRRSAAGEQQYSCALAGPQARCCLQMHGRRLPSAGTHHSGACITAHPALPSLNSTPQIIRVPSGGPKPPGILWERLSPQKLAQIRILQQLKQRIEKETGAPLPTGPDEVLPPLASRGRRGGAKDGGGAKGSGRGGGGRGGGRQQRQRRGGGGKE